MLELAESYNQQKAAITFILGNEANIPLASASADFVHSVIALQHIPRTSQELYLREFMRIVRPGGYLYFQTPSNAVYCADKSFRMNINTPSGPAAIELHTYPRSEIESLLTGGDCDVVHVFDDASCGEGIKSFFYLAQKRKHEES
jgi:ubiquinone/menaquinone biosynthesis C-methylase UbiE